jgi:cell division transport system permease protein
MPYSVREALAAFRRAPLLTSLSAAMIGLSLFVAALFGIVAYNIRQALRRVEARVEIVAYLKDDASSDAISVTRADIASFPEVSEVLYISRDQALENAKRELGEFRPVFSELDTNPLPASLEIRLRSGQRDAAAVRAVAARAGQYPVVEDVRYGNDWLDKVFLLRRIAGVATVVLGGAFALVAAVIIGAAVRMAIFARRDEIVIMQLVGATDGFIRRPFLLEGMLAGLLGGLLALALSYLTYRILSSAVLNLSWLPLEWVAGGIALGALLGTAASAIAVRRHLREV